MLDQISTMVGPSHFLFGGTQREHPYSAKVAAYLSGNSHEWPVLVIDIDEVGRAYRDLRQGLGRIVIHYAVKANPEPEVIRRLVAEGAHFDAASQSEIELCLRCGADPRVISFGNTVKRPEDIAWARERGVSLFVADATEELVKIARYAPGASVYARFLVESSQADWPLSRKFGVDPSQAVPLLLSARSLGLQPVGISFHVGSQAASPSMWIPALDTAQRIWRDAPQAGLELSLLNIGGGFPARYREDVPMRTDYAAAVAAMVRQRFPDVPHLMAEPGRAVVAEAGAIQARVLLVSQRNDDPLRWVYLNIGKFSGLAETIDEAIRYRLITDHDGEATGPCVLAGPTCDSADILYERFPVDLPLALESGSQVIIPATGAYTTSYASVGFNGFPPLNFVAV